MKIYKNRWFARFARRERITDAMLRDAVAEAERGLLEADLGGGLIKKRVARFGEGKSGGFRTLVFFRKGTRAVFAYGFAKSRQDNLDDADIATLKKAAKIALALSQQEIDRLVEARTLIEVTTDGEQKGRWVSQ